MHLSEFKAWFEGFTDGIDGIPSPKQWNKIKERVSQITNDYTPAPVFVDRYIRPYWSYPYWNGHPTFTFCSNGVGVAQASSQRLLSANATSEQKVTDYRVTREDWTNLGKADYQSLSGSA